MRCAWASLVFCPSACWARSFEFEIIRIAFSFRSTVISRQRGNIVPLPPLSLSLNGHFFATRQHCAVAASLPPSLSLNERIVDRFSCSSFLISATSIKQFIRLLFWVPLLSLHSNQPRMSPSYSIRYAQAPVGDSDDPSLTRLHFKRRDTVRPPYPFSDQCRRLVSKGAMEFDDDTGAYFYYEGPTYRTYVTQQVSKQELYEAVSHILLSMDIREKPVRDFIVDNTADFWLTTFHGQIVPLFVWVDVDRELREDEAPEMEEEEEEVESLLVEEGMPQNFDSEEESLLEEGVPQNYVSEEGGLSLLEDGVAQHYDSEEGGLLEEGMGQNFTILFGECLLLGNIPQGSPC